MTAPRESIWHRALRSMGAREAAVRHGAPQDVSDTSLQSLGHSVLDAGRVFAGCRIQRLIAHGGVGALYAAVDVQTGQPVAVKVLSLGLEYQGADLDEARARFSQEARTAGALQHPNIVAVHRSGETAGRAFIVMELLAGCDLTRYTRRARLLPEPVVLSLCARIAEALAYAHGEGVVHRDIKPSNVMVDLSRDQVKVTDFGIARVNDSARSRSGAMVGTPLFMAPEQLAGAAIDGRADLYALGVMLFQLLSGQLPYDAGSMGELLMQVARGQARTLAVVRPDLPATLDELVASLLHKRADQRPADGRQVAEVLRHIEAQWRPVLPPVSGSQGSKPGSV